ncbi:MAG: hypothetical protein DRH70_08740 [Candidatus Coatesbacteria bacterium]|nr:MAG: hypothetical protein DRH70_08740 [Candidatus Coatesbacteria bacterium]
MRHSNFSVFELLLTKNVFPDISLRRKSSGSEISIRVAATASWNARRAVWPGFPDASLTDVLHSYNLHGYWKVLKQAVMAQLVWQNIYEQPSFVSINANKLS